MISFFKMNISSFDHVVSKKEKWNRTKIDCRNITFRIRPTLSNLNTLIQDKKTGLQEIINFKLKGIMIRFWAQW